jgi:hypothetical protein
MSDQPCVARTSLSWMIFSAFAAATTVHALQISRHATGGEPAIRAALSARTRVSLRAHSSHPWNERQDQGGPIHDDRRAG